MHVRCEPRERYFAHFASRHSEPGPHTLRCITTSVGGVCHRFSCRETRGSVYSPRNVLYVIFHDSPWSLSLGKQTLTDEEHIYFFFPSSLSEECFLCINICLLYRSCESVSRLQLYPNDFYIRLINLESFDFILSSFERTCVKYLHACRYRQA